LAAICGALAQRILKINMDLYNAISSWTGWPPLIAVLLVIGGIGVFLFQRHIEFLRDEIDSLKRKLQEYQDYRDHSPDVEAKKLAERSKFLIDRIENLSQTKAQNKQKIDGLEKELQATRDEANSMRTKLESVGEILDDIQLPREGKFNPNLLEAIFNTVREQHAIYIPVRIWGDLSIEGSRQIEKGPYKIEVDFPGMNHMYLNVYDSDNRFLGQVENPHTGIYEKDYYVTLFEALKTAPSEHVPEGIVKPNSDMTIFKTSQYLAISPIDPSLFYIKVPIDKIM